ncbi:MAG: cupredoxin domain-containing protein [Candidatus Liptonbacteria bacterium]|nr:cupredoxin domain-containing protein [Candidatus Liptonbacteria bacterium]
MNKYIWLIILGVLIVGGGIVYRVFFLKAEKVPVVSGKVKEFTVLAKKDTWSFVPENIEVERGDKIIMTVVNEDSYDHGIAIDAFGVSQRMPALSTINIEFVVTQAGDFPFYCSVPCGEGVVDGKKRSHFDMVGKIKVRDIVKAQ